MQKKLANYFASLKNTLNGVRKLVVTYQGASLLVVRSTF